MVAVMDTNDSVTFAVEGEARPYVRMTQKSKWGEIAQRYLQYQGKVRWSFLQQVAIADRERLRKQKYFKINIVVYIAAVPEKDYACVCGRSWQAHIKAGQKEVKCPACKKTQTVTYDLFRRRGDFDNYEKAIVDGIQSTNIFNDKQILHGDCEIVATFKSERVEVSLERKELKFDL